MTDDLVAFIQARLDEDERSAGELRFRHPGPWQIRDPEQGDALPSGLWIDDAKDEGVAVANGSYMAWHIQRHDPARVLRGVEAKRRIAERHEPLHVTETEFSPRWICKSCDTILVGTLSPCPTLRALATEWSDHADYRQEWAP